MSGDCETLSCEGGKGASVYLSGGGDRVVLAALREFGVCDDVGGCDGGRVCGWTESEGLGNGLEG